MTEKSTKTLAEEAQDKNVSSLLQKNMLAKAVVTGVVVSTINQTGRTVMRSITRHPLLMFGLGLATGYVAHKYRKEIIAAAGNAADQGKSFVLRQKENLLDLVAESREAAETEEHPQ